MAQNHIIHIIFPKKFKFWLIIIILSQIDFNIPEATANDMTAIIINSQDLKAYKQVIDGFKEGCREMNISINNVYDLKYDLGESMAIVRAIKNEDNKPGLILTVGFLALTLAKKQFTDVPIIFCMVVNHERHNFREENITGISMEVPIEFQFAILKELHAKCRNIGVLYDPANTENIVTKAINIASEFGFNLIKSEITFEKHAADELKKGLKLIDVLWIIPDSSITDNESLDSILKTAIYHNLPTFCTSISYVKSGAMISISPDYTSIGLQAAQAAHTLLKTPDVLSLGIKQPEKFILTINRQTAEKIGFEILPIPYLTNKIFQKIKSCEIF